MTNSFIYRSLAMLLLISNTIALCAQSNTFQCGMDGTSPPPPNVTFDDLPFFSQTTCGTPLTVNCRFVFFTRDDGTGTFPQGDPQTDAILDEYVNRMNFRMANIRDPQGCAPAGWDYDYDTNVRFAVTYDYIADTEAWDYHARASAMTDYHDGSFCPWDIEPNNPHVPGTVSTWPYLRKLIADYNAQNPNTYNVFFVEDGNLIKEVENFVLTGTEPSGVYTDGFPIFSGCSDFPRGYYEPTRQFIIMTDFYSDWLARTNFGTIYYPDDADEGNATIAQWHLNEMPGITIHELGHTLFWMFHNSSCDNVMHISGAYRTHLAPYQLNHLQEYLMTTNLHQYIDCSDLDENVCDLIIDHNVTIDEPMAVYGDLIVQENVTLTVNTEMYFAPTSSILMEKNAKLIVENGLLSNYCEERWKGIEVTGGNTDFDVRIVNSTVENVRTAISTEPPLPWAEAVQFGNGIIQAENVNFLNVGRVAELVAYQPSINQSYFRDCVIDGAELGISNWNNLNVEITDCAFTNVNKYCLLTESGSFIARENDFSSEGRDIYIANVSAGFGSIIEDNTFIGNGVGVTMLGTSTGPTQITSNTFDSPFFNIWLEGDNHYEVSNNDLVSYWGAVCAATGTVPNLLRANAFNNVYSGINTGGNNAGLNFVTNCFNTGHTDVNINGMVTPVVGTEQGAANNCFTHQGSFTSGVIDLGGNPDPFIYYQPDDVVVDCLDPILAHPNVDIESFGPGLDACAFAGDNFKPDDQGNYCYPKPTINAHLAAINWLENNSPNAQIQTYQGQTNPQAVQYQRCLTKVKRQLVGLYSEAQDYSAARATLAGDNSDDAKILLYSTYVFENDLTAAQQYLNGLTNNSTELADFIAVQNVQLQRLSQGPAFSANNQQLSDLYTIAVKDHPYATYAKALYYHLTNIELESNVPLPQAGQALQSGGNLHDTGSTERLPNVYPNPANDLVTVKLPGSSPARIRVVDLAGRVVFDRTVEDTLRLRVGTWESGLYFLSVFNGEELFYNTKLVIQ